MKEGFFYQFFSSRLAVGLSVALFLLLTAAAVFRIIPWWLFLVLLGLGALGIVGYLIITDWLALRRDGSFQREMGEQARTQMARRKVRERDSIDDLHKRWQEGLEQFRRSRVGRRRGALYFLPWYLMIGKPATGKTTAIKSSDLHFPLGVPKTKGTGGTQNCDWFFTEEAILLDTAGRFTASDENQADREEWLTFLRLLRKYRRDMPINGLLVAIAADELLGKEREEIVEDARELRSRLDELIQELGIQFPVYLLITKCDLIQGFTEFFGRLPKARLSELLGWTNPSWEADDLSKLLDEAFGGLRDRCRSLRPVFLRDENDPVALRNVYLFPEELDGLTKNLAQYCDVIFRQTKFSDSPFLRGIYLTSGMQTGNTVSRVLARLGLSAQGARVWEGSHSFFLKDFFQERLKADQKLVVPTGRATVRLRVANNIGLAAVIGVCALVGLLATGSYVRNRTLLLWIESSVAATSGLDGKPAAEQMASLDAYRQAVEKLRYRNQHRDWLERFGLYSGAALEEPVVTRFMRSYERVAYRQALAKADAALSNQQDPLRAFAALDTLIGHLVFSKNARAGELVIGGESLAPWWNAAATEDNDIGARFAAAYRFYVREPWRRGGQAAAREKADQDRAQQVALVREQLPALLNVKEVTRWLERGKAIRAADAEFNWPRGAAGADKVDPAFTPAAWRDRVVPMLAALEQVQDELGGDAASSFARQYATQYYGKWFQILFGLKEPDPGAQCDAKSGYMFGFEKVHAATTRPFAADAPGNSPAGEQQKAPPPEAAAGTAADGTLVPGVEPPAWVRGLGQVVREKGQYREKMEPACRGGGDGGDPCAASARLTGGSAAPLAQLRQWVKETLVNIQAAGDGDDRRMREHVAKLLTVPVERAERASTEGCSQHMKVQLRQALQSFPARPPWTLEQTEAILAPRQGAVWQYCEQILTPFFNCVALKEKPNAPAHVPDDVLTLLTRAERLSRLLFDSGGGWRTHTIMFESIPSTSETDVRVTQTTLTVSCSNTTPQPWTLSHRQNLVRKTLSWRPDQCAEARLQVTLGTPGGGLTDARVIEIARSGPFGLLDLLGGATRSGNEFRWTFPDDRVTAAFRVSLSDTALLDYNRISLPR